MADNSTIVHQMHDRQLRLARAPHPNSPGGIEITPEEGHALDSKAVKLRGVAA